MNDFNITLFEACELLNRSKKSISRYIRRGLLHPERVKSQQGTLEYRFSKADIEAFRALESNQDQTETRQDTADKTDETKKKETLEVLEETRQDETSKVENKEPSNLVVEEKKSTDKNTATKGKKDETGQDSPEQTRPDETGQDTTRETGQDNEIITLLKETTELLRDQLKTKDDQIKGLGGKIDQLIERDRETNIILKGLQDKVYMLGQGKPEAINDTEQTVINGDKRYDYHTKPEETETRQDKTEETELTTKQVKTKSDKTGQDEKEADKDGTIKRLWKRLFKKEL